MFARFRARSFRKTMRRRAVKMSLLLLNVALIGSVAAIVIFNPSQSGGSPQPIAAAAGIQSASQPVDQLASVNIAATIANMTNIPEAPVVNGQALAEKVQAESGIFTNSAGDIVGRQQVVKSAFASNKDIQSYTVQQGDTLDSLAAKFGITSNSIRWSNSLTSDALSAGKVLLIPPVNGIVYTIKSGDTPQTLAQTYSANQDLIVADNDAELKGLTVGERIIIPGGTMPTPSYGGYGFYGYYLNVAGNYNMYAYHNCTWWVAFRWAQVGYPIMPLLNNASQWYATAQRDGLSVGRTPQKYAAASTGGLYGQTTWGYGHVVFIEGVNYDANGNVVSVNTSEMNLDGWASSRVWYNTVPISTASNWYYIYP